MSVANRGRVGVAGRRSQTCDRTLMRAHKNKEVDTNTLLIKNFYFTNKILL